MPMSEITFVGKTLITLGVLLVLVGGVFLLADHIPWLGNLPGDIHLHGKKWSFYFPMVTCIIVSIILTMLLNLLARVFGK